jgi:hypothetical protein
LLWDAVFSTRSTQGGAQRAFQVSTNTSLPQISTDRHKTNNTIPIRDRCSGAALAMRKADSASSHKEAVLKARVGLAEADVELLEGAGNKLLLGGTFVPAHDREVPDF